MVGFATFFFNPAPSLSQQEPDKEVASPPALEPLGLCLCLVSRPCLFEFLKGFTLFLFLLPPPKGGARGLGSICIHSPWDGYCFVLFCVSKKSSPILFCFRKRGPDLSHLASIQKLKIPGRKKILVIFLWWCSMRCSRRFNRQGKYTPRVLSSNLKLYMSERGLVDHRDQSQRFCDTPSRP